MNLSIKFVNLRYYEMDYHYDTSKKNIELKKLAIMQNLLAFKFVKRKTEEICKFAVQRDGLLLQYIDKED